MYLQSLPEVLDHCQNQPFLYPGSGIQGIHCATIATPTPLITVVLFGESFCWWGCKKSRYFSMQSTLRRHRSFWYHSERAVLLIDLSKSPSSSSPFDISFGLLDVRPQRHQFKYSYLTVSRNKSKYSKKKYREILKNN